MRRFIDWLLGPPPPFTGGRNARCPCDSRRKYKACCLGRDLETRKARFVASGYRRRNEAHEHLDKFAMARHGFESLQSHA